ncbi:hypothetical protein P9112_005564 [Eukaryota sp. TZLM1-RC]
MDWEYSDFNEGVHEVPHQVKREEYTTFLENHASQLLEFQKLHFESSTRTSLRPHDLLSVNFAPTPIPSKSIEDLCATDTLTVDRATSEFATLAETAHSLLERSSSYFYPRLSLLNERIPSELSTKSNLYEGEAAIDFSRTLPFYKELLDFVGEVTTNATSIVQYMSSFYQNPKSCPLFAKSTQKYPIRLLGKVLSILTSIDSLVTLDDVIADDLIAIKKVLRLALHSTNPISFVDDLKQPQPTDGHQLEEAELKEKAISKLMAVGNLITMFEGEILGGKCFQMFLNRCFDLNNNVLSSKFISDFVKILKSLLEETIDKTVSLGDLLDGNLTSLSDRLTIIDCVDDLIGGRDLMGFTCLIALMIRLSKADFDSEKRFIRLLLEFMKKIPLVHVYGKCALNPVSYIYQILTQSSESDHPLVMESEGIIRAHVTRVTGSTVASLSRYNVVLAKWACSLSSELGSKTPALSKIESLIIQGFSYLYSFQTLITSSVLIFPLLNEPMSATVLPLTSYFAMFVSKVYSVFARSLPQIMSVYPFLVECIAGDYVLRELIMPVMKSARGKGLKPPAGKEELYGVTKIFENSLNGKLSNREVLVISFLSDVISKQVSDTSGLSKSCSILSCLVNFGHNLDLFSNLNFFLFVRELISPIVQSLIPNLTSLKAFLLSISQMADLVKLSPHLDDVSQSKLIEEIKTSIKECLIEHVVNPISSIIEENLRIRIATLNSTLVGHRSAVQQQVSNKEFSMESIFETLTSNSDLILFGETFSIKKSVEFHLSRVFYDLVAISLHDFKIYNQMSSFALQKFGIEITPSFLPYGTLGHGIDILEVVRHLHVFVRKFHYDLHQQNFIERIDSSKRNVNIITIEHVSNSIKTHGTGITHSTVNFTYTFMAKKLLLVSQFLYDDHIKSRLLRTSKNWQNLLTEKGTLEAEFDLANAEAILKDVRALGRTNDGVSYFDKFRGLITELGNALGFVRLLRSGALSQTASAVQFLPNLEDIEDFIEKSKEIPNNEFSKAASDLLVTCISNLSENFTSAANYLGLLSQVFQSELQSDKNIHLKNFYLLAPALVLSHVEHMQVETEKLMMKKGRARTVTRGLFVEDGFSLGLVFVLMVLNQHEFFSSLHFFNSVRRQLEGELKSKGDSAIALKQSLESKLKQFSIVELAMDVSKMFFRM